MVTTMLAGKVSNLRLQVCVQKAHSGRSWSVLLIVEPICPFGASELADCPLKA